MKTILLAFVIGIPLLVAGAPSNSAPSVNLVRVPESGVQPQALLDSQGTLHLIYLRGDPKACDVMYCRRPNGKSEFSSSIRVNSLGGSAIAIGTVRGAQIALGRNGRLHVVWNGSDRAGTGPAGGAPMLYARLNENGDGFEPQRNLMTATTHLDGGGSVAADTLGHVYVAWHGHPTSGPQEEINRGVYVAFSSDDGKSFTPERQVNPPETGACGCCGLKAFADERGSLAILYRTANLQGNRDSELLYSTNYGRSFTAQVLGNWHLSTCPMSTHALGHAQAGLGAAWENQGQIYFESIKPGAGSATSAVAAAGSTGNRKHPAFAVSQVQPSMILAWTEGTGWEKGGALAWECLDAGGGSIASGRINGVPVWSYAAAVAESSGAFTVIY
jgi:hypothetical protein